MTYLRQAVRVVPASYFDLLPEQEVRSRAEHAALLDAIGRGDGVAARTIAEAHVLDAGAALGDWMRANAAANDRAHAHAGSTVSSASPRSKAVPCPSVPEVPVQVLRPPFTPMTCPVT